MGSSGHAGWHGGSPRETVERVTRFRPGDLNDLCDAADLAIRDGGGFGWIDPPPRDVMEQVQRIVGISEEVAKPADGGRWGEAVLALTLVEV